VTPSAYSSTAGANTEGIVQFPSYFSDLLAFEKDLTREGVEPNPGPPSVQQLQAAIAKMKAKKSIKKKPQKPPSKYRKALQGAARFVLDPEAQSKSIGNRVGGWVGDMAQKAIMAITGFGDYQVKSNTLTNGGSPPAFQAGKHMTKVCHREFVGLVTTPGAAFSITSFPINPKGPLFPWLSEIALSFEQFVIRGMVVEFKTTSATAIASTNTALGSVIIATQYNVLAAPFSTQQQMEAYEYCTSTAPSISMIHPIECAPALTSVQELYIDSSTGDPRLENLGTVFIATVGQQAASTIGELWVSYEIDLIRPKLFSGVANLGLTNHTAWSGSVLLSAVAPSIFGLFSPQSGTVIAPGSDLPVTFPTVTTMSIPGWVSGAYLILVAGILDGGTAALSAGTAPTLVSGSGGVISTWTGSPAFQRTGPSQSSTTPSNFVIAFVVTLPGTAPAVPVVFTWTPWNSSTGTANVVGMDFYATGLGTNR